MAATYALMKLSPPFEDATVSLPSNILLLVADAATYAGVMRPISGSVTWAQGNGRQLTENVSSLSGYKVLRWPSRELGHPEGAFALLHFDQPVVTAQWVWPDYALYGPDIPKFLLQQVGTWDTSPRRVRVRRSGYREGLFPRDLKAGLAHPDVRPMLEPLLQRAAPLLLRQIKEDMGEKKP